MKLNLGCGSDYREGFINIDANPEIKTDYVIVLGETSLLDYFMPESFGYILMHDILEHLFRYEASVLLCDCYKLLKDQGEIKIRVPDFEAICGESNFTSEDKIRYIFGRQKRGGVFLSEFCHKYAYTKDMMGKELEQAGFRNVEIYPGGTNLGAKAVK